MIVVMKPGADESHVKHVIDLVRDYGLKEHVIVGTDRTTATGTEREARGKGRWMDGVFIERLWRSLKYEEVYLKGYATVAEARAGIGAWVGFYNGERLHQALGYRTPAEVFGGGADAGDMTLRLRRSLDNATPLPTYPQPTTAGFQLS